jgi:N-acetylglucosamine-6-phosphate deacetylase
MMALHAARLFDGAGLLLDRVVLVDGARIAGIAAPDAVPPGAEPTKLPEDHVLAPGFVDLQVNGGGGVLFNDAPSVAALRHIAAAHAGAGTTAILPTLISGTRPQLLAALAAVRSALAAGVPGIAGLHLEGPFIAATRRGIHPAAAVIAMTGADLDLLCAPFPAALVITLAPETVPPDHIRRLAGAGATVFAGHTDADYATMIAGLRAGITGVTHLFNAMSGFAARAPGAAGAALDRPDCFAGIIADGHHLHDASLRIAFAAKGPDALFLVSDAMPTAASDLTGFVLNGERIRLHDGKLLNEAGTLAGANLTMAGAVRHAVQHAGLPLEAVLRMATSTPARAARLADRGRIAPGCRADFVALDPGLGVAAVWQGGVRLSSGPPAGHALHAPPEDALAKRRTEGHVMSDIAPAPGPDRDGRARQTATQRPF